MDNIHFAFRVTAASPWLVLTTWECVHPNAGQRNPLSSEGQLACKPSSSLVLRRRKEMKFDEIRHFRAIRSFWSGPSWRRKHSEGVAEGPNKSSARQLTICYAPDWRLENSNGWTFLHSETGPYPPYPPYPWEGGCFPIFNEPLQICNIWWGATNSACSHKLGHPV